MCVKCVVLLTPRKNSELSDYKNKVGELRSENDYQLRLKDMNYGEKIKEMKDTHTHDMEKLRSQYEVCQHHTLLILTRPPSTGYCILYRLIFLHKTWLLLTHTPILRNITAKSIQSY